MKRKQWLYGTLGLLSLLGFLGVFTGEKAFFAFFAFAVNFEYFFVKSDEMQEEYMNRSASYAFYAGMTATAAAALLGFFAGNMQGGEALLSGFAWGWAVSVLVYGVCVAFYAFRERWGLADDNE